MGSNREFTSHEMLITYEYWTAGREFDLVFNLEQIFKAILPSHIDFASSFETIGHIAHLNLREELEPFKKIIGQVLLDKNGPSLKTIVSKTGNIENVFRTFPMEVIAGLESFLTEVV